MKRKLAGILMCMLPLVGCNDDIQKPDAVQKQTTSPIIVQTSNGPVVMKNQNIRKDRTDLLDSNLDHFNIEKKDKIHNDVITQVLGVCQPRSQWLAKRALKSNTIASAAS